MPIYGGTSRNSCHQLNGRFQDRIYFFRTKSCHKYRTQDSDGNSHKNGSCGHIDASHDHRKDAKDFIHWLPFDPGQKLDRSNLGNCRKSIGKQKDADQSYCQNRNTCCDQEYSVHDGLFYIFHIDSPICVNRQG